MPESLLNHRWKLGTFAGIPLLVHWSFSLAIFLVAFSASDGGVPGVLYSVAQLLGVFFCVTLHEYGHAMAARSFGIATVDITLLPIGGVARLKKMPRIPWQELIVAVAGPAVNVVIAILLSLLLAGGMPAEVWSALVDSTGRGMMDETLMRMMDLVNESSWLGYAVMMLVVNVVLVLFNMIPAFPMDGGRVFRSLLAMTMSYRRATWIASRIGLLIAVLMVTVALRSDPPLWGPLLIACFIAYAGMTEARQVDLTESVRGRFVYQVMTGDPPSFPMNLPVSEMVRAWQGISLKSVPVVSMVGTVVGVLSLRRVGKLLQSASGESLLQSPLTAGELVDHSQSFGPVRFDAPLEEAILQGGREHRQIPVVNETGLLVGVLDLDTMLARADLLVETVDEPPLHFDARS